MASPPRFSYTHYDALGRPVASGEYEGGAIQFASQALEDQLEETLRYQSATQRYSSDGLTQSNKGDQVFTYYDGQNPQAPHPQHFVRGSVSYSEKLAETGEPVSKTWYSYDARGRVTRMVQHIAGLGQKQVQYRYGHQGSVSLVAYQQGQPDAFFHHYQYDENGRLERVYVSDQSPYYDEQGEITNTDDYALQASYEYYLHGPLKQVKLAGSQDENGQVANALQTTDYYYTVQGWLKAINNPNDTQNSDQDVFAMQLDYFSGDYRKPGSGIEQHTVATEDYSGNIQQQQWRTQTPLIANLPGNQITGAYQYAYDERYQLQSALFGSMNSGSFIADARQAYSTTGLDYDKNGNILSLQRSGQEGSLLHDFTGKYQYTTGTNQLSSVTGYKSYTYNALGQMTQEVSATSSQRLTYDVSGKVREVRNENDALIAQYQYDDRGFRVSKQSYENGSLNKTTYYARDAGGSLLSTYEQEASQAITQTEVPIYGGSRIGLYQASDQRTEYYLMDHLGNTRAIINRDRLADGGVDVSYFADYFAYGSLARSAGNKPRYGFQGEFAEDETEERGTLGFMLRDFDPIIGRWLSIDPMRQYFSPYVTMGNNPVNTIDPTGGKGGPPCTGDCDYNPDTDPSYHPEYGVTVTASRMNAVERIAYDAWNWNPSGGVVFYNEFNKGGYGNEQIGTDRGKVDNVEVWNMPFLTAFGSKNGYSDGRGAPSPESKFSTMKELMENFKIGTDGLKRARAFNNEVITPALEPTAPSGNEGIQVHQQNPPTKKIIKSDTFWTPTVPARRAYINQTVVEGGDTTNTTTY